MIMKEITDGLKTLLSDNHYNPATIQFYEREWKKIQVFLLTEYGDEGFDMERGLAYLENSMDSRPDIMTEPFLSSGYNS